MRALGELVGHSSQIDVVSFSLLLAPAGGCLGGGLRGRPSCDVLEWVGYKQVATWMERRL